MRSESDPTHPADQLWLQPGDWRGYEAYVAGVLTQRFPGIRVIGDVRIKGRKSGILRQIDVVVETAGVLAVDCKCYSRKVDVKDVEAFLAMLDDLGVRAGVLVTTIGYTAGAIKRAKSVRRRIDLQILSPDRLSEYQHVGAPLIWRGLFGICLDPPLGWVADNELTHAAGGPLVSMYPLGHTLESAAQNAGFSYANILSKPSASSTLTEIAAPHQANILVDEPDSTFTFEVLSLTDRDFSTRQALLRTATIGSRPFGQEHSLYIDYGEAVLLLVLLSPPGEADRLVPHLLEMARGAFLMNVDDRTTPDGSG